MNDRNEDYEDLRLEETLRSLKKERRCEEEELDNPGCLREILSFIVHAALIFLVALFIVTFVGQRTVVDGPSMYSTLENGDNLILEKISYRFGDPQRFDVIVFRFLYSDKTFYIKRIIGLPGETVQIEGDNIYINGEILEEDYGYEPMQSAGIASEPITLGEDEYFVLGDNRNMSSDSRDPSVAKVKRSQIEGKAWVRFWPLDKIGAIDHQK